MATTDYEPPWEWSNKYREEQLRKNSVIEKRRKKVQKTNRSKIYSFTLKSISFILLVLFLKKF